MVKRDSLAEKINNYNLYGVLKHCKDNVKAKFGVFNTPIACVASMPKKQSSAGLGIIRGKK